MANAGKLGRFGVTYPLNNEQKANLAETGQTTTIVLGQNEVFEAGKILTGQTVAVKAGASLGFEVSSNTLIVDLPDSMTTTNAEGEAVALATTSFLPGTLVQITNASNDANNGIFALESTFVSGADNHLVLTRSSFLSEAGTALRPGITDQGTSVTGNVTVIPFSNAYCVEFLGNVTQVTTAVAARTTPIKFRMNNVVGAAAALTTVDFAPNTKIYGDIPLLQMENTASHYAIVYCQSAPDLMFSPLKRAYE